MLNRQHFFTLLLILMCSASVFAQKNHSSPFSYYGIGDIYTSGLAHNRSLGGLGIGTNSSFYLNGINPAGLAAMDTMSFTFEFGASGVYSVLNTPSISEPSINGNIDYLAIGFPITRWWKTSVGFMPLSKVGYNLTENIEVLDGEETLFTLNRTIGGEGGLNQVYWSNSIQFFKKLSLGANLAYNFGFIENTIADVPTEPNATISEYKEFKRTSISDLYYSFGLQYSEKLSDNNRFTVGAVYGVEKALNTTTSLTQLSKTKSISDSDTLNYESNTGGAINMPSYYGFGLSYSTPKLTIGADYRKTNWSNIEVFNSPFKYEDTHKAIVGLEYIPKPRTASKYYQRMRYRLAGKYETSYMQIQAEQMKEVGITFGVGLPMKRSKSTLNLTFDIAKRGTFQSDVLSQTYFRLNIDLSLHDVWFIKRKYD
jgi:hypothetical protein